MAMAEEPVVPLPNDEPRRCPACGTRVALKATTCLMCGASLVEEEAISQEEEKEQQGLPGWASALIVVVLALVILMAGGIGLYALLTNEPETSPTLMVAATHTPTVTLALAPTQTPAPTSTPTPVPPRVHQVQPGETLLGIADEYDATIDGILALNPDVEPDLLQVGQILLIPPAGVAPGPTDELEPGDPTPTPGNFIIHVVAPGDTLISIAAEYGVSVSLIRAANDMSPDEETIQVNQSLVIPIGTPVPSPTPTVDPNATPTPIPPYSAPPLLSPPDGAVFVGDDAPILLQWASVSILRSDEWYALTLLQPSGGVVSATTYTRATAWRVPFDLLPTTDADVREFRWQVQVVREARSRGGELVYEKAGAPSEVRTFTWLMPTPTPTLLPSSTVTPVP
jgi:LysM repeat protein